MKRRDFVIGAATVVGTLPIVRSALGQTPCPPGTLTAEGGTSGTGVACGDGQTSSLVQVSSTPEQIALYADAASFDDTAYAILEYKLASAGTWSQGHPLYRVRPGTADDAFAGIIFDLQPGQFYDVRVTFTDGSGSVQEQAQFSTRHLPADTSSQSPTTSVNSLSALQSAIDDASPGDIIELQNGTYSGQFAVTSSGTEANPIYIRGESKNGVVLNTSSHITFNSASYVVLENMTIDRGVAEGTTSDTTYAIRLSLTVQTPVTGLTFRDLVISGAPVAIASAGGTSGGYSDNILVYNNEMTGTLPMWTADTLLVGHWANDGVQLVGNGNCVWNNTMDGYSDAITFAHSKDESDHELECNYAYRNIVRNSHNDGVELDHAVRFHAVYDNYFENVDTGISQSDNTSNIHVGPSYVFRNIFVNIAVRVLKPNAVGIGGEAGWQGWHWYNNTCVRSKGIPTDNAENTGFNTSGGTRNDRFAFRNNIFISRNTSGDLWRPRLLDGRESPHNFDVTHNAWYPADRRLLWNDVGPAFADIVAGIAGTPTSGNDNHNALYPAASGLVESTRYHEFDVASESNPFANTLTLGPDAETEVTGLTTLEIDPSSALKNAGTPIPGITDGYSGAAPDMGAIIEGRGVPNRGAQ